MPTITEITPQRKNKSRVNIYVDGQFFSGADAFVVLRERLNVGEVDTDRLRRVLQESERASAFDRALRFLALPKTEKDVAVYLSGRGYTAEVVQDTVLKLKEYGYLNDGHYANSYISSYKARQGRAAIKYGLQRKGVDPNLIEDALEQLSEDDEAENARRLAEKYMKNKEPTKENKQKLFRHLYSKGFSYELITTVLGEQD